MIRTQPVSSIVPVVLKAALNFDIKKPENTISTFQEDPDLASHTASKADGINCTPFLKHGKAILLKMSVLEHFKIEELDFFLSIFLVVILCKISSQQNPLLYI